MENYQRGGTVRDPSNSIAWLHLLGWGKFLPAKYRFKFRGRVGVELAPSKLCQKTLCSRPSGAPLGTTDARVRKEVHILLNSAEIISDRSR
jgi:hypothetical protein